jgi:hypothetical protein
MSTPQSVLSQWREVNRRANEAEAALFRATINYTSGRGPKPSDEVIDGARQLRAQAKLLLDEALGHYSSGDSTFGGFPRGAARGNGRH